MQIAVEMCTYLETFEKENFKVRFYVLQSRNIEIHGSVSRQEMENYGTIDQRLPADLFNCFIKSPVVSLTEARRHISYWKFT